MACYFGTPTWSAGSIKFGPGLLCDVLCIEEHLLRSCHGRTAWLASRHSCESGRPRYVWPPTVMTWEAETPVQKSSFTALQLEACCQGMEKASLWSSSGQQTWNSFLTLHLDGNLRWCWVCFEQPVETCVPEEMMTYRCGVLVPNDLTMASFAEVWKTPFVYVIVYVFCIYCIYIYIILYVYIILLYMY